MGIRFIGVVKTATRHFPLAYLSNLELENRGDRSGLIHYGPDGLPSLLSFVWMDRNRWYFIASGASLQEGEEYIRNRRRQVDTAPNADPERVELQVSQPRAAENYYSTCGSVDQHNRHRMDTLNVETNSKQRNGANGSTCLSLACVLWILGWHGVKQQPVNLYRVGGVAGQRSSAEEPGGSPSLFHKATGNPRAAYAERRQSTIARNAWIMNSQGRMMMKTKLGCVMLTLVEPALPNT
eukprot:scaffold18506_cov37-Attheya_sp.AAC.1